jgi:quinol-cytochrome oxidoreductase complex cytochrome b subunit
MGSLLGFCMAGQVASGIFLSFFYSSETLFAFDSVERIMRDVPFG